MQRMCVYTGSNVGVRLEYQQVARVLGKELVRHRLGLVYGGGHSGLMGIIAEAVLAEGGEVIGVMPRTIFPVEAASTRVTSFYEVESMHERKAVMAELADGFIALPGGLGTYDELFEILTWAQLGIHHKPIGLLNIAGYFNPLLTLINHTIHEGFVTNFHAHLLLQSDNPADLLTCIMEYQPPPVQSKYVST